MGMHSVIPYPGRIAQLNVFCISPACETPSIPQSYNQSYVATGIKLIYSGFETCFAPQNLKVPGAKYTSNRDGWGHFEKGERCYILWFAGQCGEEGACSVGDEADLNFAVVA